MSKLQPRENPFASRFVLLEAVLLAAGCGHSGVSETGTREDAAKIVERGDEASPVISSDPLLLPEEQLAQGWISLFDGASLFGWERTGDVPWRVEGDTIVAAEGDAGFLYTTTTFSEYVLRLEFRGETKTNSGVFLHMPTEPQAPDRDCYEVNIAPAENPFPTGSLVARQKAKPISPQPGWNSFEFSVLDADLTVKLNGEVLLEYTDAAPLGRGHIGLQHNQGKIEFRNIRLKPLAGQSIFNGRDLTGWTIKPGLDSQFTVTPAGFLSIKNGKGQIETEGRYGDFVLQLACQTLDENLNSGVFFRCIPGELWMGYESQIHNGFADGDRTKSIDCGTGGIFRRQDARRIMADDNAWFYKTIIADGPHMAVWVNSYQVSDWTDPRPPHENPRKGLRTEAGTIILQGHDPATDLLFRDFTIAEMLPRREAVE